MSDDPAAAGAAQANLTYTHPVDQPAPDPAPAPAPASPWDTLPEDAKGYVQNKGWKEPADLLESYRNLEKLRGVPPEKLLRLPDDPKDMGQVYDRLGRPDAPDKYTVAIPEGEKDAVFTEMAAAAHAAGLSDDQFKGLQTKFAEVSQKLMQERSEAVARGLDEWKQAHPADFNNVRHLSQMVGIGEQDMASAMAGDAAAFYGVLAKVASRLGEAPAVPGDTKPGFQMTPAQARDRLDSMMTDDKYLERLYHDDPKVRETAAAEKRPLHAIIADAEAQAPNRMAELEAENARLKAQMRRAG